MDENTEDAQTEDTRDTQTEQTEKTQNENRDGEYIAVLKDIEPAGASEFAEQFDVSPEEAHRQLEKLRMETNPPVDRKKIDGVTVWFVNEFGLDVRAAIAAEEIRSRMGLDEE